MDVVCVTRLRRLTGIKDPEGQNTTFGYDKDSRQTSERNPSGVVTTRVYDAANRVLAVYTNTSSNSVLESFTYGYDKAGLRTSVRDVQGDTTTTSSYTYDAVHRLYKTVRGTSTTIDTYDAVGNIVKEATSSTTTYTYDADNELSSETITGGTIGFSYDNNGNRLSYCFPGLACPTGSYTYDYENRMISTGGPAGSCTYTYAPTGERVTDSCSGAVTDLAYDPTTGGNLLATYSSSGLQRARYLDSDGVNTPVEVYEGGNHYAYQTDALGSVRMLTGGSQNSTDTYAYDTWGNPVSQSGSLANPLEYTGAIYEASSGLYDMRARFYDPSSNGGHGFLSQDPMGGGYTYAGDSPANFVDPSGTSPAPPPHTEPCNNCALPPPTPPPINPLKVVICATSILAFIGSLVIGFMGLYIDISGIAGGLYIASLGWGLDLTGLLNGGLANIGSWLQLFLDVAIYAWEYASRFVSWLDMLWEGPLQGAKLTPLGIAVEAAFLGVSIAMSLPQLIATCSDLS